MRLSNWRKRFFLAQSKIRFFEEKYLTSLPELEAEGLPNDADHELHGEYILWHHWKKAVEKARNQIVDLQAIAAYGPKKEGNAAVRNCRWSLPNGGEE